MKDINEEKSMTDKIEKLGNSTIQHGKFNDRIYLMKYDKKDGDGILSLLSELAIKNGYTKIFAKIPSSVLPLFLLDNYKMEATIPHFFKAQEDVYFMAKYLDANRAKGNNEALSVLSSLMKDISSNGLQKLDQDFQIKKLEANQVQDASKIYKRVFATYPFPIHDVNHLKETIKEGDVEYYGVWHNAKLIGLSSAEMDHKNLNAEMTDFAVLPEYRGKKLAEFLLREMEVKMKQKKIKTLYTIARLQSPGMNKTFLNMGYSYSGTLVNNTNISGKIESMNVYYKPL
ncbi:putative beta-lysine N-acetyltransferase [Sunxiuqinia sp. A32]|uniref:putative beta-lysine N-acetyltransferase n=1 Tax=Sunxiuqinia sp. A32 TaxID=3461496 RepID=UPI0040466F45